MNHLEFEQLARKGMVLDGATGSNLQKRGLPSGVCPEQWIIENADVMVELQKEFIQAGTNVLYAPTFSGNRIKLAEYGLDEKLEEMNRELVQISRRAIAEADRDGEVYVAGDLTMTGRQLYPVGTMLFEELVDIYKEQVRCLADAGVDLFVVETMMSLQECRAAVLAVKETCDLPVMVTLTYTDQMRTFYGTDPATAVIVLQAMGADAVGLNCSVGPDKMVEAVEQMAEFASVPLIAKPNAGLPELIDGETVYSMGPEEFADAMCALVEAGIDIVGGCCGTTPEHIASMAGAVKKIRMEEAAFIKRRESGSLCRRVLTTERGYTKIDLNGPFQVIGERINPTGKKALQEELRQGKLDIVSRMAEEQVEKGAAVLDVNMGMNGIDEKEMMVKVVYELTMLTNVPLSIDSSHPSVVEAALRIYPGRALINSISLEKEKFEKLIPIAKKYGAMFILLPLSDKGLPENIQEKKDIIGTILAQAKKFGMSEEDVIVDGLVATIGANKQAALETLETISYCKNELGMATACGLSNISFGLPERLFVNNAFVALAIREGLTMAIANPSQGLLMHTIFATDLLMNKEESDLRYIDRVTNHPIEAFGTSGVAEAKSQQTSGEDGKEEMNHPLFTCVLKGNKEGVLTVTKQCLEQNEAPGFLLNEVLIPAINRVGSLFEQGKYFLPQLISSAETMKASIDILEPLLEKDENAEPLGTIVIATVEHDIHDIGKNLVALMLKNYGYRVIDLGKDVPASEIVETARKEDADIIGLSALMTTTMMEMKNVVELAKAENLKAKIIIGGAVITQSFADEIGADGYSKDAGEAVQVVKQLLAQ